ncbi:PEP-CTERM sorting domain-containing protein [Kiritimatiellota bacterium B12222]|nr:PEP-CTERM sorting domain-containing protein [Kiritimatiellota bacterium B12222]
MMNTTPYLKVLVITGSLAIFSLGNLLAAPIISINLTTDIANALESTAQAGAPAVISDQWNNITVTNAGDGNATGSGTNLIDNSGAATTLDFAASKLTGGNTYAGTSSPYGWTGDQLTMHTGRLSYDIKMNVTEIPYAQYDIYVYLSAGANGGAVAANISLTGDDLDSSHFYYANYDGGYPANNYVQVTSTNSAAPSSGNYVLFTGNTGTSFQLNYDSTATIFDSYVAGIQIVAIPEPSSLVLISVGLLTLVSRRYIK